MASKDIEAGRAYVLIQLRDKVTAGLQHVERSFASFGRNFATLGTAFAAAGAGALAWPLKVSSDMETLGVAFEVMLGSATKARTLLDGLATFAKNTPFGMAEVSENAKLLLNFGVSAKAIIPTLQALGDVAAGDSERFGRLALAYGQAQAKGRLMGQEVLQMTEAGFNPLKQLSEMTGKSVMQLSKDMEDGKISGQMLTAAFAGAAGPGGRFNGMMSKMSGTTKGLLSTLIDAIQFGLKPIGDAAAEVLKPMVKWAIEVADSFKSFMERNKGLARVLAMVFMGMVAIGGALAAIGFTALAFSLLTFLSVALTPVGILIGSLVAVGIAGYKAFGSVREAFEDVTSALLSGNFSVAGQIAMLGLNAAIWAGIEQIGIAFNAGLQYLESWIPGFAAVKDFFTTTFGSIYQAIMASRWDLAGQIAMAKLQIVWLTGWNFIRDAFDVVTAGIKSAWVGMTDFLSNIWFGMVNGVAKGVVWIMEKIGLASEGTMAELKRMQDADAKSRNAARQSRPDPNKDMYDRMNQRQGEVAKMQQQLQSLEKQAAQAHADAGSPTVENFAARARRDFHQALDNQKPADVLGQPNPQDDSQAKTAKQLRREAYEAQKRLRRAIYEASRPNKFGKEAGERLREMLDVQQGGNQTAGKIASLGTFSGAAAGQALGVNNRPNEETAANTRNMLSLMKRPKPGEAAQFGS
jgi:tape measure domain-containing protein